MLCMKLQMWSNGCRWHPTPPDGNLRTLRLLQEPFSDRAVGDDAPLDQPLTVPVAAGAEPLFIQPQHVVVGRQRMTRADVGQDVAETDEFPGKFSEDLAESVLRAAQ